MSNCEQCGASFIKKEKGQKFCGYSCYWNYRKEQKLYPPSRKGKEPWNKGKKYLAICGEKHHNWHGGTTKINKKIRESIEYKLWRESVFIRDNYTCVWCGKVGGEINADHIKPFAFFPELRFAIDNGRTLCLPCHKTTQTYGRQKICR